jgi:hypothetical protein
MQALKRIANVTGIGALLCLSLLLPAGTAHAAGSGACRQDQDKFCKDVQAGQGRTRECLKAHLDELSPTCREHVEHMAKARAGKRPVPFFLKDCESELNEFCKEVQPGGGRYLRCLSAHETELSDTCKKTLASILSRVQKLRSQLLTPAARNAGGGGAKP